MSTPVTSLFFFKPIIGGGGVLEGVWALGRGQGQGGPPQPPSLGRPHGLGVACVGLVLAARVRRAFSAGRLSGGLRCCVRPMPICIVCAECFPVRNGKPSRASFDCDLLKHGQHELRPSKGWSVGPLMLVGLPTHKRTDGCLSPLVACDAKISILWWANVGPITLAFGIGVMINRDSRGIPFAKDVFINQERKLGARRRSDTVLVSTINDADQGSAYVAFRTPPAPYEKSKSLGSGGSMVARLKLKGIDGRAPPGVEPAA
ncbi:UNVERIFIED_CONTAM: hypothetical protein Sindi_3081300 [Sesamum indicum]